MREKELNNLAFVANDDEKIYNEIKEFPQVKTDIDFIDCTQGREIVLKARLKRLSYDFSDMWHKVPRKLKKRLKTQISHEFGIMKKYIHFKTK